MIKDHPATGLGGVLGRDGYVVAPGFLTAPESERLAAGAPHGAFTASTTRIGPVTQRSEQAVVRLDTLPTGADLSGLADRLRTLTGPAFAGWRPNEAMFSWYRGPEAGITAHRDSRRYTDIVAIFTLVGQADLEILADRDGPAVHRWRARAGDLCLMRGWSASDVDPRPFHRVGPPIGGPRLILALRHDASRR